MTITTPTTELEAVNTIIGAIGEPPVNSVSIPGLGDAAKAYEVLNRISREVQTSGWKFNSDYEWPITPNTDGEIIIPPNVASIHLAVTQLANYDLVWRSGKMYDRKNRTFAVGSTVKFDIVWLLTFEDMPQSARHYIAIRAGRVFLTETMGAADLEGFKEKDEAASKAIFEEDQAEDDNANILTGNYDVYRTLDRRGSIYNRLILR